MRTEFRVRERDLAGRVGELRLRRGAIETPYLFPVIDLRRQEVTVQELSEIGFNAVITNAYLLYKRGFSGSVRAALGDILVMTDSGAYQLLEYGAIDVDNETIVNYQKAIDSDIAVILDYPTGDSLDRGFAAKTAHITVKRALEAMSIIDLEERAWVLPIQGGVHLDILDRSAEISAGIDYDIYALGSPTRMMEAYHYERVADMLVTVKTRLPHTKPLHLFGGGHPMLIPFAVALGADLFDSASYILFARDGRYMVETGTRKLEDLKHFPCVCPVCSRYTPREVLESDKEERVRLLAKHNLYVIKNTLNKTKQAVVEGRLWELLQEYSYGHPSLYTLFRYIDRRYSAYLESRTPSLPSSPTSVFVYDDLSGRSPYLHRAREFIYKRYEPPKHKDTLIMRPRTSMAISNQSIAIKENEHIVYYDPVLIVPLDLSRSHPEGHTVVPRAFLYDSSLAEKALENAMIYIREKGGYYKKIVLEVCYEWLPLSLQKIRTLEGVAVKPLECT